MPLLAVLCAACLAVVPTRAEALKLATWNLNWLSLRPAGDPALPAELRPRTEADFARLRRYAEILDADVVALQEVDGIEAAARVFPPDRYRIVLTEDRAVQRVGFAIRAGIDWVRNPDLSGLVPDPEAERPLRSGADITLRLGNARLRLLAVHLKAGCQDGAPRGPRPACTTLWRQVPSLAGWVAARAAGGEPFLILGDFNRHMDRPEEVSAALQAAAPLLRAEAGHGDPCWGGGAFIDHILAGGAARFWLRPDSVRVLVYRETDPIWRDRLSDHCPLSVRVEPLGGLPPQQKE